MFLILCEAIAFCSLYILVGCCPLGMPTDGNCSCCCKAWTEGALHSSAQRVSEFEAWWTHHRRGKFIIKTDVHCLFLIFIDASILKCFKKTSWVQLHKYIVRLYCNCNLYITCHFWMINFLYIFFFWRW